MVSRLLATKLGRCPRCIRASAWGTLGAWTTVAVVSILWPLPLLVGLSFLVALSFTALLGAHLVVFTARLAALHDGHAASPRAEVGLGRRVFLLRVGWGAFWAAALGVGLFRMPPAAAAQGGTCEKPAQRNTAGLPGSNLAAVNVCASNRHLAAEAANPLFQAAATAFANTVCAPFSTQTCPFCQARSEKLHITCEPTTGVTCGPGTSPFRCTAVVTHVACRCGTT